MAKPHSASIPISKGNLRFGLEAVGKFCLAYRTALKENKSADLILLNQFLNRFDMNGILIGIS